MFQLEIPLSLLRIIAINRSFLSALQHVVIAVTFGIQMATLWNEPATSAG
jgi:hypothetical protein